MIGWGKALEVGLGIIDKVIPDPEQKAEAQRKLMEMQQQGQLKELETRMSAIIMEAKSNDPWTSRARPSFLYVMYLVILFGVPMGFLAAFEPQTAKQVAEGFRNWLHAVPQEMWWLFGTGYLGYVHKRSKDKELIMGKEPKQGLLGKILD